MVGFCPGRGQYKASLRALCHCQCWPVARTCAASTSSLSLTRSARGVGMSAGPANFKLKLGSLALLVVPDSDRHGDAPAAAAARRAGRGSDWAPRAPGRLPMGANRLVLVMAPQNFGANGNLPPGRPRSLPAAQAASLPIATAKKAGASHW